MRPEEFLTRTCPLMIGVSTTASTPFEGCAGLVLMTTLSVVGRSRGLVTIGSSFTPGCARPTPASANSQTATDKHFASARRELVSQGGENCFASKGLERIIFVRDQLAFLAQRNPMKSAFVE